jgi:hypothetical protein
MVQLCASRARAGAACCRVASTTQRPACLCQSLCSGVTVTEPPAAPQDSFWDRIQRVRNKELSILWRTFIIDSTNVFLLNAIPTVVSVSTFTAYILLGNNLTAAKVRAGSWDPALTAV